MQKNRYALCWRMGENCHQIRTMDRYCLNYNSIYLTVNKIIKFPQNFSDFKNDYKTLYPWFMESVWWVFSELWNKGMVYRGVKVMPFSTACSTPLSNFESGQNYKEVVDPAGQ